MTSPSPVDIRKKLSPCRRQIDSLDDRLMRLLAKRFAIVRKVAEIKANHDIAVVQTARVREVIKRNVDHAKKIGLPANLIEDIYILLIDEAHKIEGDLVKKIKKSKKSQPRKSAVLKKKKDSQAR